MRSFILATASLLWLAGAASAQNSPSADQIINSLKPTGNLGSGTRGIRPIAPAMPAASPATKASASAAMAPPAAKAPSVNLSVQFQTGSAALTPDATKTLDQLGKALTSADLAAYRFRIEGHTDSVGTPDYNKNLSSQRADAVANYLESKFSVAPKRLQTAGLGDSDPVVKTPPQTAEPRNRRVQVINLGS